MLQRLAVVTLSALLLLGGCRTPVHVRADQIEQRLEPGDRLRVTHASGLETRLVLERVEPDALVGRNGTKEVRVPREEWGSVTRMELAWGRTFVVLVVVPIALVGLLASAVAGSIMP